MSTEPNWDRDKSMLVATVQQLRKLTLELLMRVMDKISDAATREEIQGGQRSTKGGEARALR